MKSLLIILLLLVTLSCKKDQRDPVTPEYPNWYTIQSPIDDVIRAVWGEREKTLILATDFALFRSTDQVYSWQQVDSQQQGISGIVQQADTLFSMNGLIYGESQQIMANIAKFSVDDGQSWHLYSKYNPLLDGQQSKNRLNQRLSLNPVIGSRDTVYLIHKVFLDPVTASTRRFETPGVITSTGRALDLPVLHQLQSLYLDAQGRLYISTSDQVCGRGHSGEAFSYCHSQGGRGVVYISKRQWP